MKISSPAFTHNRMIPAKYTCQGENINPPLVIETIPPSAQSLALIVDDPDAPSGDWVHWVVYNITPTTTTISENSIPGQQGYNDSSQENYDGPCPPQGTHRYFFKVYALDTVLAPKGKMTKKDLEKLMNGHILAKTELIGRFKKD